MKLKLSLGHQCHKNPGSNRRKQSGKQKAQRGIQCSAAGNLERKETQSVWEDGAGTAGFSEASLYFLFWHTFPDRKPMFSPHKHQVTLIRSVYETLPVRMPGFVQMGWGTLENVTKIRAKETGSGFNG